MLAACATRLLPLAFILLIGFLPGLPINPSWRLFVTASSRTQFTPVNILLSGNQESNLDRQFPKLAHYHYAIPRKIHISGDQGFEPQQALSESAGLPLAESPILCRQDSNLECPCGRRVNSAVQYRYGTAHQTLLHPNLFLSISRS